MPGADSILDHPRISQNYFFPRRDVPDDIDYIDSGDISLGCAYREIDAGASTIVHFHGNGETVADYLPRMAHTFAEFGLNSLFVEYRGYGASTGSPGLVRQLDDVSAVYDALHTRAHNIIAYGRSVGSIYAIEFAHRHPDVAGLILESAIADVLERILVRISPGDLDCSYDELRAEVLEYFDHETKLAGFRKPLLVMHTRDDHLVDVTHARRLHDWAGSYQKRLVVFERGDHNTIHRDNRDEYLRNLRLFCAMHG